jgi:sterol 3beta-glucosyltransferase/vancomycin aglycone glucosyltransferase
MRIALATVGTTGDVRPFLVLGRALRDAGHEVTAVTWPLHLAACQAAGLEAVAAGPQADPAALTRVAEAAADLGPMDQVALLRDLHLEGGVDAYRDLDRILPGHDLVVLHSIHTLAEAVVRDRDLAWATAVFDPVLQPTRSAPPPGMPSLGPGNRLLWSMLDRMLRRLDGPLDDVLRVSGSRQHGLRMFRGRSPRLHMVACSPSIIRVPPDLPRTAHVTGAWLDRGSVPALPGEVAAFLDAGAAPVVVTFGSMGAGGRVPVEDAVRRMLAAGRRVVLQGWTPDWTDPGLLAIGPVEHRALFPRASVVVHHGGAGTTHTVCAAGVPSVVVPHVGDQPYWAARLAELGVAPPPVAAKGLTGERLAAAVLDVLGTARGEAAQALARRLADEDGVARAAELIAAM